MLSKAELLLAPFIFHPRLQGKCLTQLSTLPMLHCRKRLEALVLMATPGRQTPLELALELALALELELELGLKPEQAGGPWSHKRVSAPPQGVTLIL